MALRILLVEDSAPAREALADLLHTVGGYDVVATAASEMEATDWLWRHRREWDVAILDLMIDGGSGFNLIGRAKAHAPTGKAVVYSAYATPVVARRCVELGADAAFGKLETEELLRYLEGLKSAEQRAH
jgi:two-component system, OmpR family, response regulator